MKITKYYLSGGYTFEASFEDIGNGLIRIEAIVDNRDNETKSVIVPESSIRDYIGTEWYHGIESIKSQMVSRIISNFIFNKIHKLDKELYSYMQ